jgi:hypothetical protein
MAKKNKNGKSAALKTNNKEGFMSSQMHVDIATLSVSADKGTPVAEAAQLGTLFTLGQLNQLAVKFMGKGFEKGTKKSDACNQLFAAMAAKMPKEKAAAPAKAKKPAASYTAPEAESGMGEAPAEGVQTVEKPKAAKAPKVPKEPKEPRKYVFVSLGKGVKGADVKVDEKPLARQGQLLYDAFLGGMDKGKKVELTKDEILEKIDAIENYGAGNKWTNFMWYRAVFKKIGCME